MRQCFLVLSALLLASACQKQEAIVRPPTEEVRDVAEAISRKNWERVDSLTKKSSQPLLQLARLYALYQNDEFEDVLKAPEIKSSALKPYQDYLIFLSAYQAKDYAKIHSQSIPSALPLKLRNRIRIIIGDSFVDQKNPEEARKVYLDYLKKDNASSRGEVLLKLASLEWEMGLKDEALRHYENLYENFPLEDSEDQAILKLMSGKKFYEINADTHLSRVQKLRRAAQFERAATLIKTLRKVLPEAERVRLELAEAQLQFAQKEYSRVKKSALIAVEKAKDVELKRQWQDLLGWAQIRLGEYEEAQKTYKALLSQEIPKHLRELILFRLGAAAVDNDDYSAAIDIFRELLNNHSKGRFLESSHWFGAWALFQEGTTQKPHNDGFLKKAITYLDKLPRLPDGAGFAPQTLYWKYRIYEILGDKGEQAAAYSELDEKWRLSFYHLLTKKKTFDFLSERELRENDATIDFVSNDFQRYQEKTSWQRLEAFRSLHLMDWAKLELDIFLGETKSLSRESKIVIAQRLRDIQDWPDLVRWTDRHLLNSLEEAHEDLVALRLLYPKAHEPYVLSSAKEANISPFLVWAIMREESRFESDVRSIAGAEGLLQLMPSLGRRLARALGEKSSSGFLFDPRRNIRLGTYHLRELYEDVKEIPVSPELRIALMVGAYNAGIEPVKKWVKEQDTSRLDVFIEGIPYTETRQYIKRVLQSAYIYSQLYGPHQKTVARSSEKGDL